MAATHPCPACGFLVHDARHGSGATCPVCGWIDDFEQLAHPDLVYGANAGLSLRQAQVRSIAAPATAPARGTEFERDERWRPLRTGETPPADPDGLSSPVCYLGTPEPDEFVPYWRRGASRR